jgi:hypothetical protein
MTTKYLFILLQKRIHSISLTLLLFFCIQPVFCSVSGVAEMHTRSATDSIKVIDVQVVYYLPNDSIPLDDWHDRIEYLMRRAQKFHNREFEGQSQFNYSIYAEPFVSSATLAGLPKDDVNKFYWYMINEVWHSGKLNFEADAFPIILLLSDNNFSPSYNDWTRVCSGEGCTFAEPHSKCAGYVNSEGEDRPGSRCGGSRSVFWPQKHIGLGLVTADGWRVPMVGSDCVVYHEGIGHSIGLPHPEPINNSIMGLAQYHGSINQTWIDEDQKLDLGWKEEDSVDHDSLFSTFSVSHSPLRPSATDPVHITASFPKRFIPTKIETEYQRNIREPFQKIGPNYTIEEDDYINISWIIDPVPQGESVAYRIRIETTNGEKEELWSYYKIR